MFEKPLSSFFENLKLFLLVHPIAVKQWSTEDKHGNPHLTGEWLEFYTQDSTVIDEVHIIWDSSNDAQVADLEVKFTQQPSV